MNISFICPVCTAPLSQNGQTYECASGHQYIQEGNFIDFTGYLTPVNESFDHRLHYTVDAELFDYFEERRGATEHSERRVHQYILQEIPPTPRRILDVGCGSGWAAKNLLPRGHTVYSLDISRVNPQKALSLMPSERHFGIAADAYQLPFADGTFDTVIASEIIEHTTKPEQFVSECFRVVKEGGKLILSTPYKETLKYALCIHCNQKTPLNAHLHSFDERMLASFHPKKEGGSTHWHIFNNKLLIFARMHVVLRYLPFGIWKIVDAAANKIYQKPLNITISYQ